MQKQQWVFLNSEFVPADEAKISIFDRGFLFADAVYEVSTVLDGGLVDNQAHLARLQRSLDGLSIPLPISAEQIVQHQFELIKRNGLSEGIIYLQISRGPAPRDFNYPAEPAPTVVMFSQEKNVCANPKAKTGLSVITIPDLRWKRRDLKTVGLLAQSMAKQAAFEQGVDDAWMVEEGFVTEGSSNNAFIVTADNEIITRQLGNEILHGITRKSVLALVEQKDLTLIERAFTVEEAYRAQEAFITSASAFVMPVVEIDGKKIGQGAPGPITKELRAAYQQFAEQSARASRR